MSLGGGNDPSGPVEHVSLEQTTKRPSPLQTMMESPAVTNSITTETKPSRSDPLISGHQPRESWIETGDQGWQKPWRQSMESLWTCPEVHTAHDASFNAVKANVNLNHPPPMKMPWYYANPYPFCGQELLRHFYGTAKHVLSLRPLREEADPRPASNQFQQLIGGGAIDTQRESIHTEVGKATVSLFVQDCGRCGNAEAGSSYCDSDVLVTARLVGASSIFSAAVVPLPSGSFFHRGASPDYHTLTTEEELAVTKVRREEKLPAGASHLVVFTPTEPGVFALEVKVVHVNGSSDDPTKPKSLGVIGIRAVGPHNTKAFRYNDKCDAQRHIFGSPLRVVVAAQSQNYIPSLHESPFCTRANHTRGRWVRFDSPQMCASDRNSYCWGDPTWLTDAGAFNTNLLWRPSDCRLKFWTPPMGPSSSCVRHHGGRVFLLLVGDSVTREYFKNCIASNLREARLQCLFANIALEGQHYSRDYASAVASVVVQRQVENNAGVFATNLGIHHMIGPCTTQQWREFVELFVEEWKRKVLWAEGTRQELDHNTEHNVPEAFKNGSLSTSVKVSFHAEAKKKLYRGPVRLEKAVWLGPPTIHYARKGMGAQRAQLWDDIAWKQLEPLGFLRLRAIPPTRSRQEATWDGLHYASERNKVQTRHRNKGVKPAQWNGGVANLLFTLLLNLICNS